MGGISDSAILGASNSVVEMVGLDIHSEPGFVKVNQKLTKESDGLIDDFIKTGVACSDGNTYLFGSVNGKIWQRDSLGVYSLVATASPSSGMKGITGSMEYAGYVYYAMEAKLGRWKIGTAWTTREDNYATFKNGNPDFHQMKLLNLVLYMGDGNVIAQVDSSLDTITYTGLTGMFQGGDTIVGGTSGATGVVFCDDGSTTMQVKDVVGVFQIGETITGTPSGATADVDTNVNAVFSDKALDLPVGYIVKCLGQMGTDLLIGTTINHNIVGTQIFRWNTWSVSFTNSDPIPEIGINSFLATDNFVIVNAGKKGNLYIYDGSVLDLYKQVPGRWKGINKATINPEASFNFSGLPLFGLSKEDGDPTILGIYSIGRSNRNYPYVLNCEYVLSSAEVSDIEIGTIIGVGDIFIVSYKKPNGVYGVAKLDLNLKYENAYLKTRLIMPDRMKLTNFSEIFTGYRTLPSGCDITVETSKNYGAFTPAPNPAIPDTDRNMNYSKDDIGEASTLQAKINFVVSGNDAPEIDLIQIKIKENG